MSPVILFMPAESPLPVETIVILSTLRQRRGQRPHDLRHAGDQLVDDRRLVELLVGLGLHVHRLGFGFALLEDDLGFGFALRADRGRAAFRFRSSAADFSASASVSMRWRSISACFSTVAISSLLAAQDFGFLHLDLAAPSRPAESSPASATHLLLHDVGLDLVGLVGLRLLLLAPSRGTAPS